MIPWTALCLQLGTNKQLDTTVTVLDMCLEFLKGGSNLQFIALNHNNMCTHAAAAVATVVLGCTTLHITYSEPISLKVK